MREYSVSRDPFLFPLYLPLLSCHERRMKSERDCVPSTAVTKYVTNVTTWAVKTAIDCLDIKRKHSFLP